MVEKSFLIAALVAAVPALAQVAAREVSFRSGGYDLSGTLTLPARGAARAGVLLIAGSGPTDRNGISRLAPGRPPIYRQWAERLSEGGLAVLRYDKRFLTHPEIDVPSFDQEAQVADALAAVAFLRSLDLKAIYLVGHSEGGNIATVLAERDRGIAGLVVINSVQFPVDELLVAQVRANAPKATADEVERLLAKIKDGSFPPRGVLLGAGREYWAQWITYSGRSRAILSELGVPVLLVQSLDDETLPGELLQRNLLQLRGVVQANGKAQLLELRGHDHLAVRTGEQRPSEEFMRGLLDWLKDSR